MVILKRIVLVILLLPIVLLGVALFLPSSYRVERSLEMKAGPAAAFVMVNAPKYWPEWTVWSAARFPDIKFSYSGPESGVGAAYAWAGRSSGNGSLKITSSDLTKSVGYAVEFEKGKHVANGTISIQPVGEGGGWVRVVWVNAGELGWNPIARFFGVFFLEKKMGADLEGGLQNLKRKVEEMEEERGKRKAEGGNQESK